MKVLHTEVSNKGEKFELYGDIDGLKNWLHQFLGYTGEKPEDVEAGTGDDPYDHDYDEYSIYHCDNANRRDCREWGEVDIDRMKADREADLQSIRDFLAQLESDGASIFKEWLANCGRKKNGTLHKNRVQTILSLGTFSRYWTDSYGWFGPMVKVRNMDDYRAELEWSDRDCIEKY